MKKLNFLILIAVSFIFIVACQKEDKMDKKEILSAHSWKISGLKVDPAVNFGGIPISNLYVWMPACQKDNLLFLNDDGSYQFTEGATKCDETDPQIFEQGTWSLSEDESKLFTTSDSTSLEYAIESISTSEIKGSYTLNVNGVVYNYSVIFAANN
jgi:hypothetical protein